MDNILQFSFSPPPSCILRRPCAKMQDYGSIIDGIISLSAFLFFSLPSYLNPVCSIPRFF